MYSLIGGALVVSMLKEVEMSLGVEGLRLLQALLFLLEWCQLWDEEAEDGDQLCASPSSPEWSVPAAEHF